MRDMKIFSPYNKIDKIFVRFREKNKYIKL